MQVLMPSQVKHGDYTLVILVSLLTYVTSVVSWCNSPPDYPGAVGASRTGCSDPMPPVANPIPPSMSYALRSGPTNWMNGDTFSRFFGNNALIPLASSMDPYQRQGVSSGIYRTGAATSYNPYQSRPTYNNGPSYSPYDNYRVSSYPSPPYQSYFQPRPTSYSDAMYGAINYPPQGQMNRPPYGNMFDDQYMPAAQNYPFPYGRRAVMKEAYAVMSGHPSSNIAGTVDFCDSGVSGVRVKGRLTGVPGGQGKRGMHILKDTSCPPLAQFPIDSSALEHFNPFNSPTHGSRDSASKHVGDLGNIFVGYDGVAVFDFVTMSQLSLDEPYSIVNHSIIITEREDDLGSNPNDPESRRNGKSGKAIACGIITLRPNHGAPSYPNNYSPDLYQRYPSMNQMTQWSDPYARRYASMSSYNNPIDQYPYSPDSMYMSRRSGYTDRSYPYQASNRHPYPYGHVPGYSGYSSGQQMTPSSPYTWGRK